MRLRELYRIALAVLVAAIVSSAASAHEVRPAMLSITATDGDRYDVTWKRPIVGDYGVRLTPHISGRFLERRPDRVETVPGVALMRWSGRDVGEAGFKERTISVEGLDRTITDVLVVIRDTKGGVEQFTLTPEAPSALVRRLTGRFGIDSMPLMDLQMAPSDDPQALRAIIARMAAEVADQDAKIVPLEAAKAAIEAHRDELKDALAASDDEVKRITEILAMFKRHMFGTRAERIGPTSMNWCSKS